MLHFLKHLTDCYNESITLFREVPGQVFTILFCWKWGRVILLLNVSIESREAVSFENSR